MFYRQLGQVPRKRHTQLQRPKEDSFLGEGIAYEHVVTTAGFDRAYSILYHLRPPTRVVRAAVAGEISLKESNHEPLRHHHIKTSAIPRKGDPIDGRIPLMFNDDLVASRCRPAAQQKTLYRNASADEVIFIYSGGGTLESYYGRQPYKEGDYIVIPRTTTYRLVSDDVSKEDHLILESHGLVRLPKRYFNPDGQLMLGAPYYERDFHGPIEPLTIDAEEETDILVKELTPAGARLTRVTMAHNPLDVLGWDGLVYPFTFNVADFEPLTGTVHLPPPFQQCFECPGFVICTFAPRHLDNHPDAIKVPYVHSNTQAHEVLFYVKGNFGSRRGVESASMTLHPGGIPHGPHPGTIMASMKQTFTNELAVMFDTDRPLRLTQQAMALDDPNYVTSWLTPTQTDAAGNKAAIHSG